MELPHVSDNLTVVMYAMAYTCTFTKVTYVFAKLMTFVICKKQETAPNVKYRMPLFTRPCHSFAFDTNILVIKSHIIFNDTFIICK